MCRSRHYFRSMSIAATNHATLRCHKLETGGHLGRSWRRSGECEKGVRRSGRELTNSLRTKSLKIVRLLPRSSGSSLKAIFSLRPDRSTYRHIRSTLLATSILLESDRDLPEIASLGRSAQCFSSKA